MPPVQNQRFLDLILQELGPALLSKVQIYFGSKDSLLGDCVGLFSNTNNKKLFYTSILPEECFLFVLLILHTFNMSWNVPLLSHVWRNLWTSDGRAASWCGQALFRIGHRP